MKYLFKYKLVGLDNWHEQAYADLDSAIKQVKTARANDGITEFVLYEEVIELKVIRSQVKP